MGNIRRNIYKHMYIVYTYSCNGHIKKHKKNRYLLRKDRAQDCRLYTCSIKNKNKILGNFPNS